MTVCDITSSLEPIGVQKPSGLRLCGRTVQRRPAVQLFKTKLLKKIYLLRFQPERLENDQNFSTEVNNLHQTWIIYQSKVFLNVLKHVWTLRGHFQNKFNPFTCSLGRMSLLLDLGRIWCIWHSPKQEQNVSLAETLRFQWKWEEKRAENETERG